MTEVPTLNSNQRKAVEWDDGPLLVLAGPGSGKTRVLTCRIARMIEETPTAHFRVLGLTFTNKAAAEMRERVAAMVPHSVDRALLTTFHSFCADLLRQHGHHIGLRPDFTILAQDADRCAFLEEAMIRATKSSIAQTSEMLLPLIARLFENDVAPGDAQQFLGNTSCTEPETLAAVYRHYRALMIERNALDFGGLIGESLGLLRKRHGVSKQLRSIYPYICVDEFQDTTLSQYSILQHLVTPTTRNLFVVADDDQMIYQWNGASPERLWALQEYFDMTLLQLPENYRCPPVVVELANRLIEKNGDRFEGKKQISAFKESRVSPVVRLRRFADFAKEADAVAARIATRTPGTRAQCAVLARTRRLLVKVIASLNNHGVAGYLATRKNEFDSASLQWLHSVLRLANARSSREHLRRICKTFYTLEGIDLNVRDIVAYASTNDGDLLRSWTVAALNRPELSLDAHELIANVLVPRLADRLDFWKFQDHAFRWFDALPNPVPEAEGVCEAYPAYECNEEYEEEKKAWHQLVAEIAAQYGRREVSLHLLLQELDLRSKAPAPEKGDIPCFTIHASKGMEFDHVYLVGLVEDQLPSWAAVKKGDHSREMQEERRNCFVAITRTQETLTLTYAGQIDGWKKEPSRFLYEMGLLKRQ